MVGLVVSVDGFHDQGEWRIASEEAAGDVLFAWRNEGREKEWRVMVGLKGCCFRDL